MNFTEEVMVIEDDIGSVQVLSVSVWGEMPADAIRIVKQDESALHLYVFVVPDIFIARLRHRGSFRQFEFAVTTLAKQILSGGIELD